jgi:hypothetical protein
VRGGGRCETPTQSGQDQWFSLTLRREFYAEASLGRGSSIVCVCVCARARLEGHGPMVEEFRVACSVPRLLEWHNVGDDSVVHM